MQRSPDDQIVDESKSQEAEMLRKSSSERNWAHLLMWSLSGAFLLCSLLLLSKARYAFSGTEALELTPAQTLQITRAGPGVWVKVMPQYADNSRAFTHFFEPGSFRLAQDQAQQDLYYILRVPESARPFIAPRRVNGRLITLQDAPWADSTLLKLTAQTALEGESQLKPRAIILEGETPQNLRWALPASVFSALLTLVFSALAYIGFKAERVGDEEK